VKGKGKATEDGKGKGKGKGKGNGKGKGIVEHTRGGDDISRAVALQLQKDSVSNGSGLGLGPEPNRCNGFYHTKTRTVAIGPVLPPKTRHFNLTTLAPIKYLSSDCNVT